MAEVIPRRKASKISTNTWYIWPLITGEDSNHLEDPQCTLTHRSKVSCAFGFDFQPGAITLFLFSPFFLLKCIIFNSVLGPLYMFFVCEHQLLGLLIKLNLDKLVSCDIVIEKYCNHPCIPLFLLLNVAMS
jgi:hypothetical protein